MKILSIDVGMKDLAFCVLHVNKNNKNYTIDKWDIVDLCNSKTHICQEYNEKKKQKCTIKASYFKNDNYYCKTHAKKHPTLKMPCKDLKKHLLKKYKLAKLQYLTKTCDITISKKPIKKNYISALETCINEDYLEFIQRTNANNILLVNYGKSLKIHFEKLFKDIKFDYVIIEDQIGPRAMRMKVLQGMIMQHFIEKNVENIINISSKKKLKEFLKPNQKTNYDERKNLSIEITKKILHDNNLIHKWESHFYKQKKGQQDDLGDCFLQAIWFLKDTKIIN